MMIRSWKPGNKCKGFTLLELMLAISIFAVVSLLTMGGLSNVLDTRSHTDQHLNRLSQLQMVFVIFSREIQQIAKRSVRDEYGAYLAPLNSETSEGLKGIEFTHNGRFTLGGQVRLQRVAYYHEDNKLIKKIWRVLDRVEDTKPVKQVVLDDIDELRFDYFIQSEDAQGGEWRDDWSEADDVQPQAVKLMITSADFGEIYRIFEIAR